MNLNRNSATFPKKCLPLVSRTVDRESYTDEIQKIAPGGGSRFHGRYRPVRAGGRSAGGSRPERRSCRSGRSALQVSHVVRSACPRRAVRGHPAGRGVRAAARGGEDARCGRTGQCRRDRCRPGPCGGRAVQLLRLSADDGADDRPDADLPPSARGEPPPRALRRARAESRADSVGDAPDGGDQRGVGAVAPTAARNPRFLRAGLAGAAAYGGHGAAGRGVPLPGHSGSTPPAPRAARLTDCSFRRSFSA